MQSCFSFSEFVQNKNYRRVLKIRWLKTNQGRRANYEVHVNYCQPKQLMPFVRLSVVAKVGHINWVNAELFQFL